MNTASPDQDHLRLLAIFHYVVGAMTALFACIPLIHLSIGIAMIISPQTFGGSTGPQPPAFLGWLLAALGGGFFLLGQLLAVCTILSGRFIGRRTRYTFIFVVACVECMMMPFGTVLGIFTIIVLSRESVKRLFNAGNPAA